MHSVETRETPRYRIRQVYIIYRGQRFPEVSKCSFLFFLTCTHLLVLQENLLDAWLDVNGIFFANTDDKTRREVEPGGCT